ncbi:MAG TPA: glycosyltransferase family 2 protein [Terriglobia bacterium]|nr:glycosyltransferase family 2 protein [Terriglobia bacterium]
MTPISATIITRNEQQNIARAIRSLSCAEEIIVVDSESTDSTARIAADLGARVMVHPFAGFAAQKNYATEQARHSWILSLDADEELDLEAIDAVNQWKASPPGAAGYRFARRARYLGRWILHSGWYPDDKLRLFDRARGRWQGDYVHESVAVDGRVETLAGEILHYTCDSLDEHRARIEFYTDLAAREMFERGARANAATGLIAAPWIFLQTYFLRLGVLDGVQGFHIARMAARYVRRKYSKLERLRAMSSLPEGQDRE